MSLDEVILMIEECSVIASDVYTGQSQELEEVIQKLGMHIIQNGISVFTAVEQFGSSNNTSSRIVKSISLVDQVGSPRPCARKLKTETPACAGLLAHPGKVPPRAGSQADRPRAPLPHIQPQQLGCRLHHKAVLSGRRACPSSRQSLCDGRHRGRRAGSFRGRAAYRPRCPDWRCVLTAVVPPGVPMPRELPGRQDHKRRLQPVFEPESPGSGSRGVLGADRHSE